MKRSILFSSLAAALCGVLVSASNPAVSTGQSGALVRLQSTFPGTVQTGNSNINGISAANRFIGKAMEIDQPNGHGLVVYDRSPSNPYPAIIGIIPGDGYEGNASMWGLNQITGAEALLSWGDTGLFARAGSAVGANAGVFEGQVFADGINGNFISSNVVGFSSVMNNLPVGVAIGASADQSLGLFTSGAEAVRIDPSGSVGVGTIAPLARLHVIGDAIFGGNAPHSIRLFDGFTNRLELAVAGGAGEYSTSASAGDAVIRNLSGGALHLLSGSGASALTVKNTNLVGVGTNNPLARLHVVEPSTSIYVAGALSFAHGITQAATSGVGLWSAGLEAGGFNGIIGGTWIETGIGVSGVSLGPASTGVFGYAPSGTGQTYGVYGTALPNGYGVFSSGRTGASGTKSFRIDHPLDPENKYLYHYSAEGPDPLNIYHGSVTTDEKGYAWVQLPDYFESINRDPEYSLTVVDDGEDFVLCKVSKEVVNNQFQVRTSAGNIRVSWEVKAVRNDAYVRRYGAPVESEKPDAERGRYQHPELYDAPPSMAIGPKQIRPKK